jgi:hypothetical protein
MVLQACLTFKIQRGIISMFYSKCVSGLQAHFLETATNTNCAAHLASLASRSRVSSGTTSPSACPHVRPIYFIFPLELHVSNTNTHPKSHRRSHLLPLHPTHLHPLLLPLPQHACRPRAHLRPDRRLPGQGPGLLGAVR